jgi:hypothetical protein
MQLSPVEIDDDLLLDQANDVVRHDDNWELNDGLDSESLSRFWSSVAATEEQ